MGFCRNTDDVLLGVCKSCTIYIRNGEINVFVVVFFIRKLFFPVTGGLDMDERSNVIKRFQQGLERVLISTNLTARGIDVEQVTLVVNFDLPRSQGEWDPKTRRNVGKAEADCETYGQVSKKVIKFLLFLLLFKMLSNFFSVTQNR